MSGRPHTIGVITVARSDYSILRPVLRAIAADPDLELRLIVAAMHLSPAFGHTVDAITADGFAIADRVEMTVASDTPDGVAQSMSLGIAGFARVFSTHPPDILLMVGDRFEVFAAAAAALPFRIPIAHIHGGELSEGAIDDAMRHAITKLSHVHFVATPQYRDRVIQLGEDPSRVTVSGAPGLDNLRGLAAPSRAGLEGRLGLALDPAPVLLTFHPETHDPKNTADHFQAVLGALALCGRPAVLTYPNADAAGRTFIAMIEGFVAGHPKRVAVANLGLEAYYGLLAHAAVMVGNSSSGIIEAASFKLPVVNIGDRQRGRLTAANVLHVAPDTAAVAEAIARACDPSFTGGLADLQNPYGDGHAAGHIVATIRDLTLDQSLLVKRFHDLAPG